MTIPSRALVNVHPAERCHSKFDSPNGSSTPYGRFHAVLCTYFLHLRGRMISDLTVYGTYFPVPVTYAFDKGNTPRGTIGVQLTLKAARNASVLLLAAV